MKIQKSLKDGFTLGWCRAARPVAAAALAALLVAACGGDDGGGGSPSLAAANVANTSTPTNATTAADATTNAALPPDQPYIDNDVYGTGPNDSVSDATEGTAVVHRQVKIGDQILTYTATAGHLVTIDPITSKPNAKMFYVAYTLDNPNPGKPRPVTFFYNGGPGSSSVYLLLGSFGPKRLQSSFPNFTPPAPYRLRDNPESLLDRSDLVFINPVGTGYSAAIAPAKNKDFWGVDQDAHSIDRFIQRYLTKYARWNSPKFLFGESYGTARSAVTAWVLHEDGIELNGITLQSSILDYANAVSAIGIFPTLAADAFYWNKTTISPKPADLDARHERQEERVRRVVVGRRHVAERGRIAERLDQRDRIGADVRAHLLRGRDVQVQPHVDEAAVLRIRRLRERREHVVRIAARLRHVRIQIGQYDGRANYTGKGIAPYILPNSGSNDPSISNVGGAYTVLWNDYINNDLKYVSTSSFVDLNDQVFNNWDFSHTDPTGANRGGGNTLYTAGDLAATMSLNPDLKVLSANGYFDAVTPFHQTELTLAQMPLDPSLKSANLTMKYYPSGHMIYLNDHSRIAMKADLATFYDGILADRTAMRRVLLRQQKALQLKQQKQQQGQ